MVKSTRRGFSAVASMLAFMLVGWGCESPRFGSSESRELETTPSRQWLGELAVIASIVDTSGLSLGMPIMLTATADSGFAIADYGDRRIKAFDSYGKERWRFGRQGAGPGEFVGFTDLMQMPDGSLAVLDPELQRVTRVDEDGALVSTTPLPQPALRLLPSLDPANEWIVIPNDNENLWLRVSAEGQRSGQSPLPPQLHSDHHLLTEPFTARSDLGSVIAFRWSSLLLFLDHSGDVRGVVEGVEPIAFPSLDTSMPGVIRVHRDAVRTALDVSVSHGKVYVLFRGGVIVDSAIVDIYDEQAMSYVGSYLVPRTVVNIAALQDGRLATLETDSIPTVKFWAPI